MKIPLNMEGMLGRLPVAEIRADEHIIDHYLCRSKQTLKTRVGKTYFSLKLQDKTGTIDAKVWDITHEIKDFDEGDVIKIEADALLYNSEIQLKVHKIRRSMEGEYRLDDYIQTTGNDIDDMYAKVVELIASIENIYLKTLLENILIKDEARSAAFKSHSAAKSMHHSYYGGLLEHTLAVAEICGFLGGRYKYANRDLLLTGALLHDIGKIYELSAMPQNEYTDDGQMLGHIIIGVEMIGAEMSGIDGFPHELASLVKHMIISHHGEYIYGSPKLPSFVEALLLNFADNIDAKVQAISDILDADKTPGPWAGYHKILERYIRKSDVKHE